MIKLVECTCKQGEAYADGTLPHFHTKVAKAQAVFLSYLNKSPAPLYWGVHLAGLHIIGKP